MAYGRKNKRRKINNDVLNARLEAERLAKGSSALLFDPDDDEIEITVKRKITSESVTFTMTRGTTAANYRTYCDEVYCGIHGIHAICKMIASRLPAIKRTIEF